MSRLPSFRPNSPQLARHVFGEEARQAGRPAANSAASLNWRGKFSWRICRPRAAAAACRCGVRVATASRPGRNAAPRLFVRSSGSGSREVLGTSRPERRRNRFLFDRCCATAYRIHSSVDPPQKRVEIPAPSKRASVGTRLGDGIARGDELIQHPAFLCESSVGTRHRAVAGGRGGGGAAAASPRRCGAGISSPFCGGTGSRSREPEPEDPDSSAAAAPLRRCGT